ncbi:MAG: hypothetical protein ACTSUD_04370 [Alphaproteobacteria bacterium]
MAVRITLIKWRGWWRIGVGVVASAAWVALINVMAASRSLTPREELEALRKLNKGGLSPREELEIHASIMESTKGSEFSFWFDGGYEIFLYGLAIIWALCLGAPWIMRGFRWMHKAMKRYWPWVRVGLVVSVVWGFVVWIMVAGRSSGGRSFGGSSSSFRIEPGVLLIAGWVIIWVVCLGIPWIRRGFEKNKAPGAAPGE